MARQRIDGVNRDEYDLLPQDIPDEFDLVDQAGADLEAEPAPPLPWERQPDEPARSFYLFCQYRDMPYPRSLVGIYRAESGRNDAPEPPGGWRARAARWQWIKRAAAWDDERDRIKRQTQLAEIQDMVERHIRTALLGQSKALSG